MVPVARHSFPNRTIVVRYDRCGKGCSVLFNRLARSPSIPSPRHRVDYRVGFRLNRLALGRLVAVFCRLDGLTYPRMLTARQREKIPKWFQSGGDDAEMV
jgi:hypothetical protein